MQIDLSNANKSSDLEKIKTDITNSMLRAMNLWNSALAGYNGWNVASISLDSDPSSPQLRIQYAAGRPMAMAQSNLIILADNASYTGSLNYQALHEYGHILGLDEGYTEKGRSVPKIPQASSVMKDVRDTLTQEDINAIRYVWDILQGKAKVGSCPSGYVIDKDAYSNTDAIFCAVPTTSSAPQPATQEQGIQPPSANPPPTAPAPLKGLPLENTSPVCLSSASDPDGDGWGYENNASCKVSTPLHQG